MKKITRISLYMILVLLVAGLTVNFYINHIIHQKATQYITHKIPEQIQISYKDILVESFQGNIQIDTPNISIGNEQDSLIHTKLKATAIVIEDVSYIDFLFNKEISAARIKIINPEYIHYRHKKSVAATTKNTSSTFSTKPIRIDAFVIENGRVHILENDQDETALKVETVNLTIQDVLINKTTAKQDIPFQYDSYNIASSAIFAKAGLYETVSIQDFGIDSRTVTLSDIHFKTKYSKEEFSEKLQKERDHFDTTIDAITIKDVDIQFKDRIPYVSASMIRVLRPIAAIYRDKLVADDPTVKSLYSTMFREMKAQVAIDKTIIENGKVTYTEKIKQENDGGTVTLSDLEGTIDHLGNVYGVDKKTTVQMTSRFMESTPLAITWQFDSSDSADTFEFKGSLGNLASEDLNAFIQPNLNIKLDGVMKETYFSVYGNRTASKIDMRMKFDNLEVRVLEKNGREVNKFLSGLVNLFVKDDSSENINDFKTGTATADRDPTKSFFNYMWLSLKAGLLKIISA